MFGLVEGRGKEKEQRGNEWELAAGLNLLLFFQGGMGTVTTAVAMIPFFSP